MKQIAIGVSLGGSKTVSALVDATGGLISEKTRAAVPGRADAERRLDAIASAITAQYEQVDPQQLAAIGVASSGSVDPTRGVVVAAGEGVPGWRGADIVGGLRARLPWAAELPIHVQNDVGAQAVGECWRGAGAQASSVLMLVVDAGIGAAYCVDGVVQRGTHHMAGMVGGMRVAFGDVLPEDATRRHPATFETNAAGPAIVRIYRELGGDQQVRRAKDVLGLASAGDQLATRVVEGLGRRVGRVLGWLTLALDPQVLLLGGSVPNHKSVWWAGMEGELRSDLPKHFGELPVRPAELRGNAALLGAARDAFGLAGVSTVDEIT